jgi:hypothetical protein
MDLVTWTNANSRFDRLEIDKAIQRLKQTKVERLAGHFEQSEVSLYI